MSDKTVLKNLRPKAERIFEQLKKVGVEVYDVNYDDGYFLFEFGEDTVVRFRIKGCKGWLFAIWWGEKEEEIYEPKTERTHKELMLKWTFFGQYEATINKFKPSASSYVLEDMEYDRDGFPALDYFTEYKIKEIVNYIKKHPYIARYYDVGYPLNFWDYDTNPLKAWWEVTKEARRMKKKETGAGYWRKRTEKLLKQIGDEALENPSMGDWLTLRGDNFKVGPVAEKGNYVIDITELSPRLRRKIERHNKRIKKRMKKPTGAYSLYGCNLARPVAFVKGKEAK